MEEADSGVIAAADGSVATEEIEVGAGEELRCGGGGEVKGDEEGSDRGGGRPIVGLVGEPAVEDELGGRAAVGSELLAADEVIYGGEKLAGGEALDIVAQVEVGAGIGEERRQEKSQAEPAGVASRSLAGVASGACWLREQGEEGVLAGVGREGG